MFLLKNWPSNIICHSPLLGYMCPLWNSGSATARISFIPHSFSSSPTPGRIRMNVHDTDTVQLLLFDWLVSMAISYRPNKKKFSAMLKIHNALFKNKNGGIPLFDPDETLNSLAWPGPLQDRQNDLLCNSGMATPPQTSLFEIYMDLEFKTVLANSKFRSHTPHVATSGARVLSIHCTGGVSLN